MALALLDDGIGRILSGIFRKALQVSVLKTVSSVCPPITLLWLFLVSSASLTAVFRNLFSPAAHQNFSQNYEAHQKLRYVGSGRLLFIFMVSIAFVISGVIEKLLESNPQPSHSVTEINQSIIKNNQGQRYCDPPNITVITIYHDSNEETNLDDYDLLQNQETSSENNISTSDLEEHQADIFSNWGYILSFFPASFLTTKHGPDKVFSYSIMLNLVLIVTSLLSKNLKAIEGAISGILLGVMTFSFYDMTFHFVSAGRNTLISFVSVRQIGLAIGEILMFYSIQKSYAFYTIVMAAIVWFIVWSKFQFKSSTNNVYFEENGNKGSPNSAMQIPWKSVFCSRPVWMTIAAIFGASCGMSCIFTCMRWYLKYIYFLQVEILTSISSLLHIGFAVACGCFIDFLIRAQIVSVTSSRRMVVYVSHFIPAGLLFVLGFLGCDQTTPTVFYCLAITLLGANYTGAFSSPLDLAPKYSGSILAVCFTFGSLGWLFMNYFLSYILLKQDFVSWRFIFSLNSLILLLTAIFFMLRGSGSVQPWNDPDHTPSKDKKNTNVLQGKPSEAAPASKPRTKSIYMVEKKILKVLHVQEPDKFTRVRAYSTSLPNERSTENPPNIYRPSNKKRASIS